MSRLTQERLKEVLHYNPETGFFTWKVRTSNRIKVGDIAGNDSNGYIRMSIFDKDYLAHRLAWLYMKGYMPKNIDIDHEDQIRHHNWWSNLRLASRSCNMKNIGNRKDNKSGVKGVSWVQNRGKWCVQIATNGKNMFLGQYTNFDEAVCTRLAAEQCVGWEGCDSNSPAYQYVQKMVKNRADELIKMVEGL